MKQRNETWDLNDTTFFFRTFFSLSFILFLSPSFVPGLENYILSSHPTCHRIWWWCSRKPLLYNVKWRKRKVSNFIKRRREKFETESWEKWKLIVFPLWGARLKGIKCFLLSHFLTRSLTLSSSFQLHFNHNLHFYMKSIRVGLKNVGYGRVKWKDFPE